MSRYNQLTKTTKPQTILIHGVNFIITMDANDKLKIIKDHSILIQKQKIKAVFPKDKFRRYVDFDRLDLIYDAEQKGGLLITPGLINMHAHPPMYLLRSALSLAEDNLEKSLKLMARLESKMTEANLYLSALGDLTEQQRSGITTTLSHYGVFEPIEKAARACQQQVINCISAASNSHPKNTPRLVEKFLRRKNNYTIPGIALHYVWKANPSVLKKIASLLKKYDTFFTLHAAETAKTVEACRKTYGQRPIQVLEKYGLLSPKTILSHCVHLEADEIALIKRRRAIVVHLPTSNLLHRSGQFPYREFKKNDAAKFVCLGTDSVVSKNRLDLLTEALTAKTLHQARTIISYQDLFAMCTIRPAKLLGYKNLGKILPNFKANIAFWKLRDRGLMPFDPKKPTTLLNNLITHGSRLVRDLMINGQFIISNRRHNLIDETKLLDDLQRAHLNLKT